MTAHDIEGSVADWFHWCNSTLTRIRIGITPLLNTRYAVISAILGLTTRYCHLDSLAGRLIRSLHYLAGKLKVCCI